MHAHLRRLACAASLTAVTCAAAASPASAGHTLKPAVYPSQVNPNGTLYGGSPGTGGLLYEGFRACTSGARPGIVDLGNYLRHWWGSRTAQYFNCRGTSLHGEGRAVDYFVNVANATEKAWGDQIFGFLRRTDTYGGTYALMKRFGVQTVIWNCRIYSASDLTVRTYFRCDPNNADYSTDPSLRHTNHVHIDITRAAAERQRTAWTGYKPCPSGHTGCVPATAALASAVSTPSSFGLGVDQPQGFDRGEEHAHE